MSKLTFNGKTTIKPGDIKYEDVNHDGDYSYSKDRVFLGQPTPKVTLRTHQHASNGRAPTPPCSSPDSSEAASTVP